MESASGLSESIPQKPALNTLVTEEGAMVSFSSSSKTQAVDGPSRPAKTRVRKTMKGQPTPVQLAKLGVKVRDFAFEETDLPPVRTIYCHPKQIQPSVNRSRGLQRQSTELADEGVFSQQSQGSNCPLERTITEPVLSPPPLARQQGFLNLANYTRTDQSISPSRPAELLPQIAFPYLESLNPNDIKTPVVTPNGSLVWEPPNNGAPLVPLSSVRTGGQLKTSSRHSISSDTQMNTSLSSPLPLTPSFHKLLSHSLRSQTSSASLRKRGSFLVTSKVSHSQKSEDKPTTAGCYNLRKRKTCYALDSVKQDSTKRIKHAPDEFIGRSQSILATPSRERASSSSCRLQVSRSPLQHKHIRRS